MTIQIFCQALLVMRIAASDLLAEQENWARSQYSCSLFCDHTWRFDRKYLSTWLHEIKNSDSSHELSSQFCGHNIANGRVRKEEKGVRGVSVVAGFSVWIPSHSEGACFPSCFWELKISSFSLKSFNWKVYFYSLYIGRKSWVNEPTSCITTFPITLLGGPFSFP